MTVDLASRTHATLFAYSFGQLTWTNQPAAATELNGDASRRTILDLAGAQEFKLVASVSVVGAAGAILEAEADTGAGFVNLANPQVTVAISALNHRETAWTPIISTARINALPVRIVGTGGDAVADPVFSVSIHFR